MPKPQSLPPVPPGARADAPSRQCAAHSSRTGLRCKAFAIHGGTVCRMHGGSAPQVKAAARRRLAEEDAERLTRRFDLADAPRLTDPVGELSRVAGQVVYVLDALSERTRADSVAELGEAEFVALERALDRASRLLVEVNRLGLETKQAALNERQADIMLRILAGVVTDLGHDPDAANVRGTIRRWLATGSDLYKATA